MNCFNLPPFNSRGTSEKAKQHRSPEMALAPPKSEYELLLHELPKPARRVVPNASLPHLDSSFASVRESFNAYTISGSQTRRERKKAGMLHKTLCMHNLVPATIGMYLNSCNMLDKLRRQGLKPCILSNLHRSTTGIHRLIYMYLCVKFC